LNETAGVEFHARRFLSADVAAMPVKVGNGETALIDYCATIPSC
jgi:hypothetical protein